VAQDENYYKDIAETLDALTERVSRYRLPDLTVLYCNKAWAAGHDLTPAQAVGRTLDTILTPAELDGLRSQLAILGPDNPFVADDQLRPAPDGDDRWVEWVDRYLPGPDGAVIVSVGRDVTERHITELKLAESEMRFRDLADKSADVVWRFVNSPSPHFDYMSPAVENILGYPPSVFLEDFNAFLAVLDREGQELLNRVLAGEPIPAHCDVRFHHANGSIVIGELQITTIPRGAQGVGRDVTELRSLQRTLNELALHDPLTGLANRRLLNELLEVGLARSVRTGLPLAVAFLDLDDLKTVNDAYGHDAGDIVLCETARRLMSMVRGVDVVARIGGDEFVIVYEPSDASSDDLIRVKRHFPRRSKSPHRSPCSARPASAMWIHVVGHGASALLAAAGRRCTK
jgi:diguanylate cyclase (GGDEF)-like protein/PAS domain S-box-containing protein